MKIERFKYNINITNITMTDVTVSLRVDRDVHERMRQHEEINWSGVLRKTIAERLEQAEAIDYARAKSAADQMDRIRKSGIFNRGRPSVEIIREWRQKRK